MTVEQNPYEAPEHDDRCPMSGEVVVDGDTGKVAGRFEGSVICICTELEEDAYDDEMEKRVDRERDK